MMSSENTKDKTKYILHTEGMAADQIVSNRICRALFELDKHTSSDDGADYKPLYTSLYKGITAIIENTSTYDETIAALKQLQREAEELYIEQGEEINE